MSSQSTDNLSSDQEVPPMKPAFSELEDAPVSFPPLKRNAFARGGIVSGGGDPTLIPALLESPAPYVIPRGARYEGPNLMNMQLLLDDQPIPADTKTWGGSLSVSGDHSIHVPVDMVNHPKHYTSDPSGVECITITRWRNFCIGNAIKYLWRAGLKDDASIGATEKQIEDLEKSIFYIKDEIERLKGLQ